MVEGNVAVDPGAVEPDARMLQVARIVAKKLGIQDSYKLFMNVGTQVQAVHHVHLHVTGGWAKTSSIEELDEVAMKLHNDGLKGAWRARIVSGRSAWAWSIV